MNAEDFMELLNAEQDNFTFEKYDLFDNNCNHFSNFCTEMLLGKSIPNEYLNQAEEFKGTPIYNMLKGMQVNMNNNRNNYNISYQGFQQSGNGEPTAPAALSSQINDSSDRHSESAQLRPNGHEQLQPAATR